MLPLPKEFIDAEIAGFDRECELEEKALSELIQAFPANRETSHVLLKVIAINRLYRARVLDKDMVMLAEHITRCEDLDGILACGSPTAVPLICQAPTSLQYYSFATKFCSWHNQMKYCMWDGNVDAALWGYKQQESLLQFKRVDLGNYALLLDIVHAFRGRYGLEAFSLKDIDKYLWRIGDRILNGRANPTVAM